MIINKDGCIVVKVLMAFVQRRNLRLGERYENLDLATTFLLSVYNPILTLSLHLSLQFTPLPRILSYRSYLSKVVSGSFRTERMKYDEIQPLFTIPETVPASTGPA